MGLRNEIIFGIGLPDAGLCQQGRSAVPASSILAQSLHCGPAGTIQLVMKEFTVYF